MAAIGQTRPLTHPRIRTPMFVFGIALALVAFLVMFAFGIVFVRNQDAVGQISVVVASRDIDARTPITPDMLTTASLPTTAVPPNTYLHLGQLNGMFAAVGIYKGEAVSSNLVTTDPSTLTISLPFLQLPKGFDAMTLPTSEQTGVAGYIHVGDYINVVATIDTSLLNPKYHHTVVQTVFTSLLVLKVGPQTATAGQTPVGVTSSITLAITPCDVDYMQWLLVNAQLKYTLPPHDQYPAQPALDTGCPSTQPVMVGPAQIDARWHFTGA